MRAAHVPAFSDLTELPGGGLPGEGGGRRGEPGPARGYSSLASAALAATLQSWSPAGHREAAESRASSNPEGPPPVAARLSWTPRPQPANAHSPSGGGGPRRPYRFPDRLADFFDPQGLLPASAPKHWALQACQQHPLSRSSEHQVNLSGLSTRQRQMNAQKCMDRDQERIDQKINQALERHRAENHGRELEDVQFMRHLKLLFEPLVLTEDMLEEFGREVRTGIQGPQPRGSGAARAAVRGAVSKFGMAGVLARADSDQELRLPAAAEAEFACGASANKSATAAAAAGAAALTNAQRVTLLSAFQRYVLRVAGPGRAELMRRATWFKFLHHCGLLGFEGGVSFVQAAKVFAAYAEKQVSPPSLTFVGWTNSVQRILRGPNLYKSEADMLERLFGICLRRCEARLSTGREANFRPPPGSAEARLSSKRIGGRERRPSVQIHAGAPATMGAVCQPRAAEEKLTWNILIAEEQMCEPEVLQLVQASQRALRGLFTFFVERSRVEGEAETAPDQRADQGGPTSAQEGNAGGLPGEAPLVMSKETFKAMLCDFGVFPEIVQEYSLRQHLSVSLGRWHQQNGLTFQAFAECLCRMAFVYLSFYGNTAQQASPAKCKCLWLLALLRTRCRDLGLKLGLPLGLAGEGIEGGVLWRDREEECHPDSLPLSELVLWRTLDADMPQPTQPVAARGALRRNSQGRDAGD